MGEQSGEKSEEPTPHRLREAREKGQVAKSKEVTVAVLLLSSYLFFRYSGEFIWKELTGMAAIIFQQIPYVNDFSYSFVGFILFIALKSFALAVAPIFAVTFIAAIIAESLQTGFVAAADPLMPKFERLNPFENAKKLVSIQGLFELVKSIIKIVVVFWIIWFAVKKELGTVVVLMDAHPWNAVVLGGSIAFTAAMRVGIFYLFIALLDYLYRRWEYMKNLKMTKQEVKEEYKRLEGDPLIKQRIRELQRQVAYQRMMAAVPQADVVVTNPTHIAVALQYNTSKMSAPTVLAKGMRLAAEEIKQIAEENLVPIVENEPLAQSIFKTTEVGKEIPPDLYQAVAEVLAFVYKLKKEKTSRKKKTRISSIPAAQPTI